MPALLALAAANAFLAAFGGTWLCTQRAPGPLAAHSTWTIAATTDGSWVSVRRDARGQTEIGFVGYLPAAQQWLYEEFQSDGGFASHTSSGPQNGVWTWTGTYTTPQRSLHGAFQWRRQGADFRQGFGRMLGPSFRELASATCRASGAAR